MNKIEEFKNELKDNQKQMSLDTSFKSQTNKWVEKSFEHKYTYNFTWLGRPVIQFPQDMIAMQEIIWSIKPDLIIETGIAHGGSLIFHASMLELIGNEDSRVLGIDIDIREHNRVEIEKHKMFKRIDLIQGSSIDDEIVKRVHDYAKNFNNVLLILDSNHTHEHVLEELKLYSDLVSKDSYIIVQDTIVDELPDKFFKDRPWDSKNNPKTAVEEFLRTNNDFIIDKEIEEKLLITNCPSGYLRRVK